LTVNVNDEGRPSIDNSGMTIGDRLRQVRTDAQLTLEQAGDLAGVSKQAISQIEKGVTKNPEAATLEPLCRKLRVNLHWLMTGKGPRQINGSVTPPATEKTSHATRDLQSRISIPDPAILHEALTLLLFDLDHGGPRGARSASNLLLDLYWRIAEAGGQLPEAQQIEFEEQARLRGEKTGVAKDERSSRRGKRG